MKTRLSFFIALRHHTRQDIQTAVEILCTRVKKPDEDDYKKLTRESHYLCIIKHITLTIEADKHPNWWLDSSYAVHPDMQMPLTPGEGTMYSGSLKQKLNTKKLNRSRTHSNQ